MNGKIFFIINDAFFLELIAKLNIDSDFESFYFFIDKFFISNRHIYVLHNHLLKLNLLKTFYRIFLDFHFDMAVEFGLFICSYFQSDTSEFLNKYISIYGFTSMKCLFNFNQMGNLNLSFLFNKKW